MDWYISAWKKALVFKGRARRKEYWLFHLFTLLGSILLGLIMGLTESVVGEQEVLNKLLKNAFIIASMIAGLSAGVRRMHDIGKSGWWIIVPFVSLVFACFNSQPHENEYGANPKLADLPE